MTLNATERVDIVNIGLMLLSAVVAMVLPFELFLFVYAVLGPLHYLTEISWLHDKGYFTKGRYDAVWLLIVGIVLMGAFFQKNIGLQFPENFAANLMFIAVLSAMIFVLVKNPIYKIGGILLLVFASQVSHNMNYFLVVFIPTLMHVYVFTALFMLYGTLKSKSRVGIFAFLVLVSIPFILWNIFPERAFYPPTEYSKGAYEPFMVVNIMWFRFVDAIPNPGSKAGWDNFIFNSPKSILLMRFIAFAYTYHYLNWFSKTKVIQWHKVPKLRFVLVIVIWAASITLYMYDYVTGMKWLLFLSFMHVLLELPLNFISVFGIGSHLKNKLLKPSNA